jgi:hypothetical protein
MPAMRRVHSLAIMRRTTIVQYHLHADLNGWVMRHGGFPSYNGMAIMPNNAAQEF